MAVSLSQGNTQAALASLGSLATQPNGPEINRVGYGAHVEQGTQVYLMIGNQALGFAQSVAEADNFNPQAFYGLGQMEPLDIQPMQFRGALTVNGGRLYGSKGQNASWFGGREVAPTGSGTPSIPQHQGIIGYNGKWMLRNGALTIVVMNIVTKIPDSTFFGCVPQTFNVTWTNGAYTVQNFTALYRSVK